MDVINVPPGQLPPLNQLELGQVPVVDQAWGHLEAEGKEPQTLASCLLQRPDH